MQPVSEEPSLVKGGQIACFAASAPVHFLTLPVSYCTWFQETSKWPQISRTTVDGQNASLVGTSKLMDRALPTQLFFSKAAAGTSFGLRADLMFKRARKKKRKNKRVLKWTPDMNSGLQVRIADPKKFQVQELGQGETSSPTSYTQPTPYRAPVVCLLLDPQNGRVLLWVFC